MNKLTDPQRQALHGALFGPLFLGRRNWKRPETRPATPKTVEALIERGFFERSTTRQGVPMVRLTEAGREAIGATARPARFRRTIDIAAEAAAALHERIAP